MTRIVGVGCGVVGAAIAYELSLVSGLEIAVFDQQPFFGEKSQNLKAATLQGSTGAALGVLMGAISQKTKGRAWQMRQTSIQRYDALIPELEDLTDCSIPYNRQGILRLITVEDDRAQWEALVKVRQAQGWLLEIWERDRAIAHCPHLNVEEFKFAVYSPQDRQVDPIALTVALVEGAKRNGVEFHFGVEVLDIAPTSNPLQLRTSTGVIECDRAVISAGLGSTALTATLQQSVNIQPVLGQAVCYQGKILGDPNFQPVITGDDVHIVPTGEGNYWVGATVEFPSDAGEVVAEAELLEQVQQRAIAFCPALAELEIIYSWSGLRPRPQGRPAPIIEPLPGYPQIWLATGHYRNGVLLAPATALTIKDAILSV